MPTVSTIVLLLTIMALFSVGFADEKRLECVVGDNGECVNVDQDARTTTGSEKITVDEKCPERGHIIRCAGAYLDTNKNGKLDRVELDSVIASLPW